MTPESPSIMDRLRAGMASLLSGLAAGARRMEGDGRTRSPPDNARRLRVLVGEYDVVLGAFAVGQDDLDYLSFGGRQDRIDLSVDGAANANINHPAISDAGTQGIASIRHVCGRRLAHRGR